MSYKRTSKFEQFQERRGSLATRISSRGHGFEQSVFEGLHKPIAEQVPDMIAALRRAEAEAAQGGSSAERAHHQILRLRGQLGNLRKLAESRGAVKLPDLFMTVARHVLPQEMFDAVLADARWLRYENARSLAASIAEAMASPPDTGEGA